MYDKSVNLILDYIEYSIGAIDDIWPEHMFEYRANERWAANEILERVIDSPFDDPELIVEEFFLEMLLYESQTIMEKKKKLFSIAKNTAEKILVHLREGA